MWTFVWKFVGKSGTTVIRRKYVDSEVSPKFCFTRGVGAGSARGCRFQQGWEWGARVLWTAVQRDELFRGLRMQYFRLRAQEGVRFFWLQALNTGKTQFGDRFIPGPRQRGSSLLLARCGPGVLSVGGWDRLLNRVAHPLEFVSSKGAVPDFIWLVSPLPEPSTAAPGHRGSAMRSLNWRTS